MSASDLEPLEDTMNKLPIVIPRGTIDVPDERYTFRSGTDIYFIRKAPIDNVDSIVGALNGTRDVLFTKGTDYQVIDNDNDGELDSIDWSIGGTSPDDGATFFVSYRCTSVISRYVSVHDDDIDGLENDIDAVIKSAQVSRADGANLGRVGGFFGNIGRRSGKIDDTYRQLLQSLVQSFKGRGTVPGIKFAISAGTGIPVDQITINEDFEDTGYTIQIDPDVDTDFLGNVIVEMAELADPSGVSLLDDPIVELDGDGIGIEATETTVDTTTTGLGSGTLTLNGNSTLQ